MIGLRDAGQAVLGLLSLPYLFIAVLLVWWHARQGVTLQRRLFHVRLYGSVQLTLIRLGGGVLAGAALSAAGFAAGAELTSETLLCVWVAMFVLALFRLRFICLAYAAGVLGIVQVILTGTVETDRLSGIVQEIVQTVNAVNIPGLLFLAGLLHFAEGVLVRIQGAKTAIPLFLEGKRGKPLGAYALSGAWPIPLLWLVPAAGSDGFALPWTPLFGMMGSDTATWTLMAFPVLIGFSDRTETFWPEEKARSLGNNLMVYGILIAALAAGSLFWEPLVTVASAAAFVLHEGLLWWSRFREAGRLPLYAQGGSGVRILAVLPGTPAAELGLMPGEMIRKVNGAAIRSKEELHAALQRHSAFCKLEVTNREGHLKFVQRARYEGEHHQLGLILAPDEAADYVAAPRSASLWQGLKNAGARRRRGAASSRTEVEAGGAEPAAAGEEEDTPLDEMAWADEEAAPADPGLPPRGTKAVR